jgi:RimJ/RimL family protein N-acetyltransferase
MSQHNDAELVIVTPRLELHHIGSADLITLFEDPMNLSIYEGMPFKNPHHVLMDDSGPLRWRVPQVKADAAVNKWFVRWMVEKSSREIVGSLSFHGPPDHRGMVEIGLGVHTDFQGNGFATEALIGMWSWVVEQKDVHVLRYTVDPNNEASVAVITKFGFSNVGTQIDPEDGPEDIYEMSAEDFRIKFC